MPTSPHRWPASFFLLVAVAFSSSFKLLYFLATQDSLWHPSGHEKPKLFQKPRIHKFGDVTRLTRVSTGHSQRTQQFYDFV